VINGHGRLQRDRRVDRATYEANALCPVQKSQGPVNLGLVGNDHLGRNVTLSIL
jgi:hypothetical protein